ncbi:MAG: peptidoglycan-binding protein, partial [Clostridia bacterium]|nr:peptidoglycan-binding protein [Clostridia bacterium]
LACRTRNVHRLGFAFLLSVHGWKLCPFARNGLLGLTKAGVHSLGYSLRYAFWQAGRSYKDSDKYIRDITEYKKDSIVLEGSLFCIMSDGTVGVAEEGNEYGADKVNKWNSIIALSSSYYHTVGVKRDGTVIATGKKGIVSCNVKNWRSIKKVCADGWIDDGKDYTFTVGLKEDGTVVATGNNDFGQCNVSDWSEIEDIITFRYLTIGLKKDGTVLCTDEEFYEDLKSWDHIISLSKGHDLVLGYYVIGLKENGTVVTTLYGVDVDSWKNITTVISGTNSNVVIGLTADGSVIASKNKNSHIWYSWKDIVAIAAGSRHTLGLRADGTVVAMGDTDDGQCRVSDWTDIVSIYAYYNTSYGVKSDGSFVAVGDNRFGSCNFEDWDLWDEWDIEDSIVSDSTDVPENEAGSIQFPALKKGAKGEAVIRIQIALIEKGYLSGKADGDYGQMTEDAVKQMQIKYGMEATGVADEEFQKKLYGN